MHRFLCSFVIALALAPATRGDEPQWSSPDTQLDMTYVPKVGDQAVIGTPRGFVVGTTGPFRAKVYEWRLNHADTQPSLEEAIKRWRPPTYDQLFCNKELPAEHLVAAGTPAKLLTRHTIAADWDNTTVAMPAFEVLVTKGPHTGKHLYMTADRLHRVIPVREQDEARAASAMGGGFTEMLRGALLLEQDNRQYAIEQYKEIASFPLARTESKLAKARLTALGIRDHRTDRQKEWDRAMETLKKKELDRQAENLKKPAPRHEPEPEGDEPEPKPAAPPLAPVKEKPTIRILDGSWKLSASGNYMEVSCTIRNVSKTDVKGLTATIIYRDENDRLIKSDDWHVENLDAGETTTFTASHQSDPRMHHYNVQFKARVGFEIIQLRTLKPND
jgi:hypothetical protein